MKVLFGKIKQLDKQTYGAYKRLNGKYTLSGFSFSFLHIQGDPYAPPSRVRATISLEELGIESHFADSEVRRTALADYLLRRLALTFAAHSEPMGTGHSGMIRILQPGQEILQQSAVFVHQGKLEVRFSVGLPGDGRRIKADEAVELLINVIPDALTECLYGININTEELQAHIRCAEVQQELRNALSEQNLTAFIADGSILPRRSGDSAEPLTDAVPFHSPDTMRCTIQLSDGTEISGMGVPRGITMIAGGGYHGKSTLLKALENGVYDHIPGDGRELVITEDTATKIRAEEGRPVHGTNISDLIRELPGGVSTKAFITTNASGSTSQASNLCEAVAMGAQTLLIDEDISAVNFLIRDERMQHLVQSKNEPIIPLIDRIKSFHQVHDLSFVLVIGACGDYLPLADRVVVMRDYQPIDATEKAAEICAQIPGHEPPEIPAPQPREKLLPALPLAAWKKQVLHPRSSKSAKSKVRDGKMTLGDFQSDLRMLDQLLNPPQAMGIAMAMHSLLLNLPDNAPRNLDDAEFLRQQLGKLEKHMNQDGLSSLKGAATHDFFRPRPYEIAAALFRLRG